MSLPAMPPPTAQLLRGRARPALYPLMQTAPEPSSTPIMSRIVDRRGGHVYARQPTMTTITPSMVPCRAVVTSYHDLNQILPAEPMTSCLLCVYCSNKDHVTGEPRQLLVSTDRASHPEGHIAYIQPCGHLAGWSCMEKDAHGRCPTCGILWRRNGPLESQCPHTISITQLRLDSPLTDEEAGWLVPQVPGGHVPDQCRLCGTLGALRELTRMARAEMRLQHGAGDTTCTYATDGLVNGFLEGDELKPFAVLDIVLRPPVLTQRLMAEARAVDDGIHAHYDGRTPPAEGKMVGGMPILFKVAGAAAPLTDQFARGFPTDG